MLNGQCAMLSHLMAFIKVMYCFGPCVFIKPFSSERRREKNGCQNAIYGRISCENFMQMIFYYPNHFQDHGGTKKQ